MPVSAWHRLVPWALAGMFLVDVARGDDVPAVPAEAPPEAAAPDRAARVEMWIGNMKENYESVLHNELEHLREAYPDLPPAARRAIREAGERATAEQLRDHAVAIDDLQRFTGQFDAEGRVERDPAAARAMRFVHPVSEIRQALAAALEEQVGVERARDHLEELAWREERRRAAVVRRVLLLLDNDLHLSDAQWDAIGRDLLDHWDERLDAMITWIRPNAIDRRRHWPWLHTESVLPHLEPSQRALVDPGDDDGSELSIIETWVLNRTWRWLPTDADVPEDPWWHE